MPRLWIATLISIGTLSGADPSLAEERAPSFAELQERERQIEQRRELQLRKIEHRLQSQTLDPGDALMERTRIEHAYQGEMDAHKALLEKAYRNLDGGKRKPARGDGGSAGLSPAIPRIPSQSIVTYPQKQGEQTELPEASHDDSQAEGRQKNVGVGVRELEF